MLEDLQPLLGRLRNHIFFEFLEDLQHLFGRLRNHVEMLEDLVLAALRDATAKMGEYHEETMGSLDMPDLGGMLGG